MINRLVDRERQRHTERQRDRQRDRGRETETYRQRERDVETAPPADQLSHFLSHLSRNESSLRLRTNRDVHKATTDMKEAPPPPPLPPPIGWIDIYLSGF